MEWLFDLIDKIVQSAIWHNFLSRLEWVDWFTLAMILIGIIYGAKRGLIREIVEIFELLVLILVVFFVKGSLANYLFTKVGMAKQIAEPAAFISVMLPTWWVIHWVDHLFSKSFHTKLSGAIKVPGGILLGVVHVLILWGLVSQVIFSIPIKSVQKVYQGKNSMSGPFLVEMTPTIYTAMTQPANLFKDKEKKKV